MGILQQASGTFTASGFAPTLPATSSSANCVVLIIAGNTTITTPTNWTLRTSQVNQMGHYLFDRQGVALQSVTVTSAAGQGTWWIAEIAGGSFQTGGALSQNAATNATTYSTNSLTPTAGTRTIIASLGSTQTGTVRTLSGWTNSFVEVADVCQPTADYPMQGVAVLDNLTANGSTAYSTTGTYSTSSGGRSAIIASYVTTAGGGTTTGTLSAQTPKTTASIAGSSQVNGTLSAALPTLTASIIGSAGSITGTLSAQTPKTTASLPGTVSGGGGTGIEHTIWGATAHPATLAKATDGPVKVATAFYTFSAGAAGWRCVGGRLYIPTGITVPTSAEVSLWTGTTPDLSLTPDRTATMTGITAGQWNEVRWSTPYAAAAAAPLWIGYRFADGSYLAVASPGSAAIQSADTANLYLAGATEFTQRSRFRYDSGTAGNSTGLWGIDVIVDEGASSSTTGTLNASVPTATASITGSSTVTGTLSTQTPKLTSSISNTVALTIAQENALSSGVQDRAFWFDYGNDDIPGFARSTYYTPGQTAQFSVNYSSAYTCEVWRMGWYGGSGNARKVATFAGTTASQPAAATIPSSNGAVTCSAWSQNVSWSIPADATPGWYWLFMKNGGSTQFGGILFCVSDANAKQPILVVASEATWGAAYNGFGGNNVYGASTGIGNIDSRALCSSYDKPVISRTNVPQTHFFNGELAQLRFFERFGFDVGYTTIEQINNDPTIMDGRNLVVFSGHNEYIPQRVFDKTESIIAAGTNVANFSANDFFWRTTYAGTTFPTGSTSTSTGRVMWCKKDSMAGPSGIRSGGAGTPFTSQADWTGTWQDTRYTNRKPSNALLGDRFIANGIRNDELKVPFSMKGLPLWRNASGVQALTTGQTYTFGVGTAGMEWDFPDGPLPSVSLSASSVDLTGNTADADGAVYNLNSTSVHAVQMVRNGSAHILNFNTTQWGWALDDLHLRGSSIATATARQATLNGLCDLGAIGQSALITGASLTVPTPVSDIDVAYGLPTGTSGSLNATLPKATASVSGVTVTAGIMAAAVPSVTAAVSGTSLTVGTLAAATPVTTASVSGSSLTLGTVAGAVPLLTASLPGVLIPPVTGSLSATVPLLASSLTGQSFAPTVGTVAASTPLLASSLPGVVVGVTGGVLNASAPLLVSAVTGSSLTVGSLNGSTPLLLASLPGGIIAPTTGQLVAGTPVVVGSFGGTLVTVAILSGTLPKVRGRFDSAVQAVVPRRLHATLQQPRLKGTMRPADISGRMEI